MDHDAKTRAFWLDRITGLAARVVLSNPDEAAKLGRGTFEVIPNGCSIPTTKRAHAARPTPTLLFVGLMEYPPNADAATFLVRKVVPRLRSRIGNHFEVRIVGAAPPEVVALESARNVVVTGYVEDLEAELAGADVAVVPLLHGTGTRLKILEAFAHKIPVVSTSIGASGLGVGSGKHLLLADDPTSFAEACDRLLHDHELRASLVSAAYELVTEAHDWRVVEGQIGSLAEATLRDAAA